MPIFRSSLLPAAIAALINATVWGLAWLPLKWLQAHGVASMWVTLCVFSACTMAVLAVRPTALLRTLKMPQLLWLMLASGMTNVCFNVSLATGDVVRSILLFYLMPMWVVVLARWLLHEPITAAAITRIALALLGAVLVLGEGRLVLPLPSSVADWLAVVAGFSFGLNNVLLRRFADLPDDVRSLAMFSGAVVLSPIAIGALFLFGEAPQWAPQDMAWLVLLAFALAVLVGNLALQYGATRLRANVLSVLMLAEILVASLSSWWAGTAELPPSTLLGGLLIISASLLAITARGPAPQAAH
ncbi:DMT family transporter [Piscinibacter sakaiensis]|uniref:DMT family transporter n=1 Tax=Piscinibacter sakaiensis TaxID=1547922 RepID=UPI003AAF1124